MKHSLLKLFAFASLFLCIAFCTLSIHESFLAQQYYKKYYGSKQDAIKMNVLDKGEAIIELLSFGYLGNVSEEKATREEQLAAGEHHTHKSVRFTWTCLSISILSLAILFLLSKDRPSVFYITGGLHSLLLLIAGILCPMLEINYVFKESVPLHVSKSIFDTIYTTYKNGPVFLSIILALCSFIVPFLKCIDLCLYPLREKVKFVTNLAWLCKILGKWSMADVFVVAILVTYFVPTGIQPKGGGYAESFLKSGFYYFLFYCLISLIVNQLSSRKQNLS